MSSANERIYRSLRGLEKTASTSRVLNLAAISVCNAGNEEHAKAPLFKSPILNGAVILKHRLRQDEMDLFGGITRTATKVIVPFDRADLSLGGRAVFVGEDGWEQALVELRGGPDEMLRDVEILEAIDEMPSLDPSCCASTSSAAGSMSVPVISTSPTRCSDSWAARSRA